MTTATIEPASIYRKIALIQKEVGAIEKNGTGPQQKGSFRYIKQEDILDKIHALLVENDVIVIPTITSLKHDVVEANNRMNIYSVVQAVYRYVSVEDGSYIETTSTGEGSDIGSDTATRKAATQAMKIAHLHTFTIPGTDLSLDDREGYTNEAPASDAPATPKAVRTAKSGTTTRASGNNAATSQTAKEIQAEIVAKVAAHKAEYGVEPKYGTIGNRMFPNDRSWASKPDSLKAVLRAIENGEVE